MNGPYCPPPVDRRDIQRTLEDLSVQVISMKDVKTHLGILQLSLPTQKAILKRRSVQGDREVVIKCPDVSEDESMDSSQNHILREAVILGQIRHPNVVQLHGVIMEKDKVLLVIEHFPKEDLRRYLIQIGRGTISPEAPELLLNFSQQIALGMHYLASKGFIHKDLAARSIFVTKTDDCKVGELGKSLEYTDTEQYVENGGKLPIRWMAPETMHYQKYSTASDIWSYGCLLYEIWSLGRMPFGDFTNAQVVQKVDAGYRNPPPPGCPRVIYELMVQCWHPDPLSRPTFKDIINSLLGSESNVLKVSVHDPAIPDVSTILGGPLEAGSYLYKDLQDVYAKGPRAANHMGVNDDVVGPKFDNGPLPKTKFMMAFPTSSADIDHMYNRGGQKTYSPVIGKKISSNSPTVNMFPSQEMLLTDDRDSDYEEIGK